MPGLSRRFQGAIPAIVLIANAAAAPARSGAEPITPPAGAEAEPLDPCAPVRRVSLEFGAAFATFAASSAELALDDAELAVDPAAAPAPWRPPPASRAGPPAEPFLATKLLPTARTNFDREWRRVRDMQVTSACATGLLGMAPQAPSQALLQQVNRWTNRYVRYEADRADDRWADAAATLRDRRGDCEDLAIAKMQLLAALGVADEAMYLTLVHDLVLRRDHAVLVVRIGNAHWMLDAATDQVLDAAQANDYRPVLSFSGSRKWLHGH